MGAMKEWPRYHVLSIRVNEVELAAIHSVAKEYNVSEGKAARYLMFGEEYELIGKDPKTP